ncbi:MAG TPA: OmpA family protein [Polyangiaceae bacterium]|jgi:outer membrane protein OmpA-like peptidoglycan-associated protein
MSLRASCFASLAVLVGATLSATAGAQTGGSVTFGGGASTDSSAAPAAPAPPPAAAPAGGAVAAPPAEGADQTAAAAGEAAEGDEAAEAAEWAERDRLVNESNTLSGGSGLLKTQHAESGAPGQFRLGFTTDWFSAGFLCTTTFPCRNPNGGAAVTSDTMNHVGGTVNVGATLFKVGEGSFDGYAAVMAYANSDTQNKPSLLQVLGDMDFGIKYMAPVGNVVHLGLFTELWLINGTGAVGLDGNGTSAKFGGVGTLDLRGLESHVPLRFSLNAVYAIDNSSDVLTTTEAPVSQGGRGQPVTRIERFGLGVNRVDQFDLLIGGEFFAAEERVRPFVEEKIAFPNNRQGYACKTNNPSKDNCLANDSVIPSTLTLGSRFFPWKRGFSLLAAIDIGTGGTSDFIEEMAPTPPWTLYIGAGWAVDTWERPPVVKTKTVEKVVEKVKPLAHVVGFVHETGKNDPIAGAIVAYRDHPELAPLSTGADGKFADDIAPGQYTYDIKADGFKPGSCDTTVPKEGGNISVDCALEALPRVGTVDGHVRDAETSQPVAGVQVILRDSQKKELRINSDASGGYKFEAVAPGTAEVSVTADGYLVLVTPTDVKARQEDTVDLMLRPKPKTAQVQVGKNEITIKTQIQFALDSAVILPESFGLLTEIADTLIRHPEIKRVEVQGHTDNSGTPEHNKVLSEQRAEAVRAWLVQHGVVSDRLVARGFGQEKPLVPNVTAGNRARNRRVQFIILEKDGSASTAPTPPTAPGERKKNPLPGF